MNEAIARYQEMLTRHPHHDLARFSLAKALFDAGQFDQARQQFLLALERKPDWMAVQILLGKCDHALGNIAAARRAFTRARQLAVEQNHEGPRAEMDQLLTELP